MANVFISPRRRESAVRSLTGFRVSADPRRPPHLSILYTAFAVALCVTSPGLSAGQAVSRTEGATSKPETAKTPVQIVDETVAKVLKIFGDPEYKKPERKPQMRAVVRSTILEQVDMDTVAALTLSTFHKKFTDAQLKKFHALFSQLLFATYIKHLEKYTDEKVVIVDSKNLSDSRVQVFTKTITDTAEIPVDFSFVRLKERWMLYDVHIEGVSLIRNYRTQFREILVNRSVDEFLVRLDKKVKENEAAL